VGSKLRVPLSPLATGDVALPESEAHYVAHVRRLRAGDELVLFDVEAKTEADASITLVEKKRVHVHVGELRPAGVLGALPVTLLQAVGKGDKPERVIREATMLGVERIVIVETDRSVPRGTKRIERWRSVALDAARQSGRGDVPELVVAETFEATLASSEGLRFVLVPDSDRTLTRALQSWKGAEPITLAIGPEGGFSAEELALAIQSGFHRVRFGTLILRTETAATAVLGALLAFLDAEPSTKVPR
jgi:16S rRNA (uracil1498-N3)-methyltransferase